MSTPAWALSLAYWLHMLATVAWIGGLAALGLYVLPAARKTLEVRAYATLLESIRQRLDPLGWFSLVVLASTGMIQMSANPNYKGFLAIDDLWALAILLKHLVFLGMAGLSAYLTWGLIPRLQHLALRQAHDMKTGQKANEHTWQIPAEAVNLQQQELLLLRINLILGALILALTAIARAA